MLISSTSNLCYFDSSQRIHLNMSLIDKVKEHWIGSLVAFAAICIGTTWIVATEILVKPRDFTIEQQKTNIADLKEKIKELQGEQGYLSTQKTNSSGSSAIVLQPTWIYSNQPLLALDDQVLINVSSLSSFIHAATFDLRIPEQQDIHWGVTIVGTRNTFVYKGESYFFDVLEVTDRSAKISISKKL